jgi:uncharacterized delta-60 repeat protein
VGHPFQAARSPRVTRAAVTASLSVLLVARLAGGAVPGARGAPHSPPAKPDPYEGAGHLDPSFDLDGRVVANAGSSSTVAEAVLVQPDGKIVGIGHTTYSYVVARNNPDGSPDQSFGNDGVVTSDFDFVYPDTARGGALLEDGRILAGGTSFWAVSLSSWADVSLMRYLADGTLDPSFGEAGQIATDLGGSWDEAFALALQDDGKVLVVGWTSPDGIVGDILLIRYNADGTVDPGFGLGGVVVTDLSAGKDLANAVAIQPDGKIVVAGQDESVGVVLRYTPDGTVDESFGTGGLVTTHDQAFWYDLVIQPDGRIVVAGLSLARFMLVRYLPDGSPDLEFGAEGVAVDDFSRAIDQANALSIQPDGKLVAVGTTSDTQESELVIARHLPDGSPDFGFGADGKIETDSGPMTSAGNDVTIQADGSIVAAGTRAGDAFFSRYLTCTIEGTAGNDVLTGTAGNDVICAREGNDSVRGGGGLDVLFGQDGNDRLFGEAGSDFLFGGTGNDSLLGGTGNDSISGGGGGDRIRGNDGVDRLDYGTSPSRVMVDLSTSQVGGGDATGDSVTEVEDVTGSPFDDRLSGSPGSNHLEGGDGADTLDGRSGFDVLEYLRSTWGVDVDLRLTQQDSLGEAEGDVTFRSEGLIGSDFIDFLAGTDERSLLDGGPGDDGLDGYGADDALVGGTGSDHMDGGDGFDRCDTSLGNDTTFNCEA